jgi:transposase InsO family protein
VWPLAWTGGALDNIFIERLWRSVKYEDFYPRAYRTISEAHPGPERYFQFYNTERVHQSLGYSTPWATHYQERAKEESGFIDECLVRNPDLLKKPHLLS